MKKLLFLYAALLMVLQAEACRFTIREIGYSNLYLQEYKLVFYADSLLHHELIDDYKSIAFAYTIDANVEYTVVQQKTKAPKISFVSGSGHQLYRSEVNNTEDIMNSVIHCFSSPVREKLLEEMGDSFACMLYFEGKEGNVKDYDSIIKEAVDRFKNVSPHLDKAVSEEVEVIKVAYLDRAQEKIVLAALEISEKDPKPFVVVVYGRGRMSGKPLMEEDISAQNIFNKLVLIGTDCECGIDLGPLLETSIPLNWPNDARQKTAKMLNFDVGNPMVLAEMSGILSKGAGNTEKISSPFSTKIVDIERVVEGNIPSETENGSEKIRLRILIFSLAFAAMILLIGIIVYLRKRQEIN